VADLALTFDLLARDNASRSFRAVGNSAERAGKQGHTAGSLISSGMKMAAAGLLGSGLIAGFTSLYQAADESRKIGALTAQVIKTTGGAAGTSAKQVGDLAGAIARKTGVDDEAIQSGANLLLTFTNIKNAAGAGNDIFNQTTQIMTDMAAALGKDASSSAIMLGKALNDPTKGITALSRAGVSFTAQQKDQIRTLAESGDTLGAQKIILAELGKQFGGAAEAAATPLGKLQQRAGDLAEKVGGYLLPVVDDAATFFMDDLGPALGSVGGIAAGVVVPAFTAIASVVGGAVHIFNGLPGPLQAAAVAFGAFLLLRGPVTSAFTAIGDGATNMALRTASAVGQAGGGMGLLKASAGGVVGMLGGPWGAAIAAGTLVVAGITSGLQKAAAQTDAWSTALLKGGAAAASVRAEYEASRDDAAGFEWMKDLDEWVGFAPSLDDATEAMNRHFASLSPVEQAQSKVAQWTEELAYRTEHLGKTHGDTAIAQERLAVWTGILGEREGYLTAATNSATGAAGEWTTKLDAARTELDEGKKAIDNFKLALDLLTGSHVSMIEVESAFQSATAAAEGAMTDMGGAVLQASGQLNLQSENGRKAADVLLDVRNSGNDLIATMKQQGATDAEIAVKNDELRTSFINTAAQMGINEGAAKLLADQILGIPAERNTAVTADTTQATTDVNSFQRLIDGLKGGTVQLDFVINAVESVRREFGTYTGGWGTPRRAAGGPVWPRQTFLVGEDGPELVQFGSSGFVTPAARTRDALAAGAAAAGTTHTTIVSGVVGPEQVAAIVRREQATTEFLAGIR